MKTKTLKILLIVESVVMILLLWWFYSEITDSNNRIVLLRENSPDGDYELIIQEIGKPRFFYPVDRIQVTLSDNNNPGHYTAFRVDISTGGDFAKYEIEWMEDGVQIVLSGDKFLFYILPFKVEMEQ